ncbi:MULTISPECIES: CvpA family protein [unclassified Candidatus Frackibacter]|uniref:CvpA family protein n=1 Tax=unclassified Candidatus Frackibacter TaxID=2648818 RepID=UPI000798DB47|nr:MULTISPECIES: CvpA family protein [unclassified Candidatus Frackibacter]KXS40652.1 MAG: membrane protein required for colicin V production [Candidatus Frackibacter sp. T328-2]SDC88677.1 membrane protein required for colicin V production [Candidatus Frackibacter sp. WG11]SEN02475.1 membrane protein required for colicin V production [Candidatus Frackibacter sp. WG12]SFM10497.1 membrane protein required for colicin V production [Candidatus Frackibacter sp. WG13]
MVGINLFDLGIIIIIIVSILRGYQIGLIRQVISIIALIAAFYFAMENYQLLAVYFNKNLAVSMSIAEIISFGLIIIVVSAIINIVGYLLNKLTGLLLLSMVDGMGGALLGLVKGGLIIYILLILISKVPLMPVQNSMQASIFAQKFLSLTPVFEEKLQELIH